MIWQRSKHLAKHSLKWLNWTLLLPALVLSVLLAALLYTSPGLRLSLLLAENLVPGLQIENSNGSWLGGNTLSNLRWQNNNNSVAVAQLQLDINNRCLLRLALCVEELSVQGLILTADTANSEQQPAAQGATSFWLPFPVSINRFTLDDASIDIDGHQLRWQHLSMALQAWGNKVQLSKPLLQQVSLTLASQPDDTADAVPAHAFAYQPPQLANFKLPLSVFIEHFQLDDFSLIQPDGQPQQVQQMLLSMQWQGSELNLTQLELKHQLGTLHSTANITTTADYPLSVTASLQINDTELAGQQLELVGTGSLAALVIEAAARGPVAARLTAELDLLSATLPHRLQLNSELLQWPLLTPGENTAAELRLSRSQFTASGNLAHSEISGRLSVASPHAPDAAIEFSGQANYDGLTLSTLLLDTLGGQISSPLTLDWQQGLSWQGQIRLRAIHPGLFWPDYPGELNGVLQHSGALGDAGQWQLAISQLDVSGTLRDYALQLSGSIDAADNSGNADYRFRPQLVLRHADNTLQLSGNVQRAWQLDLQLDIPDLAQSVAQARGSINGRFDISGQFAQPQVRGTLNGSKLQLQQYSLTQLSLNTALWRDAAQAWHTEIDLNASGGKYQQQQLHQLQARLSGNEQQHQLSLTLDAAEHTASLTLSGTMQDSEWQGTLQQANVGSLLGQWQLTGPVNLQYQQQQQRLSVNPHCWQQQHSQLCAVKPLVVSPRQLNAALTLSQLPLDTLQAFLPDNSAFSGSIDASLNASWQQGKAAAATLTLSSLAGSFTEQLATPLTLAWQSIELNSTLSDNAVQSTLQFTIDEQAALLANVRLSNLDQDDKTLAGDMTLQNFNIDFLQPLLGEFSELGGLLDTELRLSGSLRDPLLHGTVDLRRSRVKGKLAPVDIDNADVALSFDGKTASLNGLITTPSGEINLAGAANWYQLNAWQAELTIKGDELRLQVPQARLQLAPDLTLTASPQRTRISGTVQIPNANINIDSLPASAVALSDDLVLLNEHLLPLPAEQKTPFLLETDISVQLGNRVRLSAFGLQTRLSGNLRVRQQPQQPLRVNGDVNLIDGTFRAYGQDLLIRKGKMNFNGPADQPFLNIEAIRNPANMEDDVIAGIRVNGPADDPSVVVFSEPAKAQANALAYLLMGRNLDSESGGAGNAVTTSLIGITLSSSSKVVGEIGEVFGLQDLTLDTAGAGDNSQVTVSGYLSRDLQLKYGYGIFNAVGEFTLRYRLMRRLYLEAISGLNNAVDLLYKFEFD